MVQASRRKFHYIYKILRNDGRYYIGMHSTDDLEDGYFGSGKLITASVKKHGKEKHIKEILEFCDSRELLKAREKELVDQERLDDEQCMNLQAGGGGGFINDQHRIKAQAAGARLGGLSAYNKNKGWFSEQAKNRFKEVMSLKKERDEMPKPFLGKKHTDLTKQKMREVHAENKHQRANKNSQFGTRWVHRDGISKKIKDTELEYYLMDGYSQGRVKPK